MPCSEYGGKVSMTYRAEPAAQDEGLAQRPLGSPDVPVATGDDSAPQPFARPEAADGSATGDSSPVFFAPPGLRPLEESSAAHIGFTSLETIDETIFASYTEPLPFDPAYSTIPPVDPSVPAFAPPSLSADSFGAGHLAGKFASAERPVVSRLGQMWKVAAENVGDDYRNFYDCGTMAELAGGLVLGSVLANTSLDQELHDWYQQDVRSPETDHFADFWKTIGEVRYRFPPTPAWPSPASSSKTGRFSP